MRKVKVENRKNMDPKRCPFVLNLVGLHTPPPPDQVPCSLNSCKQFMHFSSHSFFLIFLVSHDFFLILFVFFILTLKDCFIHIGMHRIHDWAEQWCAVLQLYHGHIPSPPVLRDAARPIGRIASGLCHPPRRRPPLPPAAGASRTSTRGTSVGRRTGRRWRSTWGTVGRGQAQASTAV